jgi:hypothetical protein
MRISIFIFFISLVLINTLNSCKKDSKKINEKETLLTKQNWMLVSNRMNTNNNGWVDIFSSFPICQKDNKLCFKPDYSFNWDEGLTKCNASDSQTFNYGTWQLSSNETKLFFSNPNGMTNNVDINVLDDINLITLKKVISGIDTVVVESRYIH